MTELTELMRRLDHEFGDPSLLQTALTHPSYTGEHGGQSYQRLEFLGDAVLQIVISDYLYAHMQEQEGVLSRIRAKLVCEETLSRIADGFGLSGYIRLSGSEIRDGGMNKPSILSDVCEAVFAAVYLDAGFDRARALILSAYGSLLSDMVRDPAQGFDYKSRLQMLCQQKYNCTPVYASLGKSGPDHNASFTEAVYVGGILKAKAAGHSRHGAQQEAARLAFEAMSQKQK